MATKCIWRPPSLPFPSISPKSLLFKTPVLSFLSTISAASNTPPCASTLNPSLNPNPSLSYGPSLHKGRPPPQPHLHHPSKPLSDAKRQSQEPEPASEPDAIFDESMFTRAFDIAAIRVPSGECFALENRLRGHLLNWPRIRNIARVPGDDVDEEVAGLMNDTGNAAVSDGEYTHSLAPLDRRMYGRADGDGEQLSPVLYREKLVKTFNSRGFVKFRNLAKISRPPKKKKRSKEVEEGGGERKGNGKNAVAVVEVVEGGEMERAKDLSGLLGEEFRGRAWRGPTRLLLLDESYAGKSVNELPQAIKALLDEGTRRNTKTTAYEHVRCKLTLFYNYWQMNEILEALLPKGVIIPSAYETVGHIAHLNLRDEHLPYKKLIAKVVLDKNRPKVQTVVNKIDAIHNDYRTMELEVLAGNRSLLTMVVENGMRFLVDLSTVYWNSRLATERQRLVNSFKHNDVVCDVFSGVGPIAISAAKKVKRVYANDLNPYAVEYLERNSVLSKLERKIQVFNMDGRRFIDAMFASTNANSITQVVMNLPNDALEYLDAFRGIYAGKSKDEGLILPRIHVYGFSKAQDPDFDFHERIRIGLSEVAVDVEMRRVRLVAPGKWMLCASFLLPESVAYARNRVLDI